MRNVFADLDTRQTALTANQLLDHWPDLTAGADFDHSGNGYHGSLVNTSAASSTVQRPSFFSLNGTSARIDMSAHLAEFANLTDMTLFVRFVKSTTASTALFPIVSWSHATASTRFVYLTYVSGNLRLVARDDATTHLLVETTGLDLDDDRLHDVCVTFGTTGVKIYVDGAEATLSYTTGSASTVISLASYSFDAFDIGALRYSGGTLYFDGFIDRVRVFDKVLDTAERATCRSQGICFPLAGQSNMHGTYGPIDGGLDATNARVLQMRRGGTLDKEMKLAADSLDHFTKISNTVGPGLSFAKPFVANLTDPYDVIAVIPVAESGTGFADGDWTATGVRYLDLEDRTQVAIDQGFALGGTLWLQGERDSQTPTEVATHLVEMGALIDRLRANVSDLWGSVSDRLFVCAEIGYFLASNAGYPEWAAINANYATLAGDKSDVVVLDTAGLADGGDNLHYSAASCREIGVRAAALFELASPAVVNVTVPHQVLRVASVCRSLSLPAA